MDFRIANRQRTKLNLAATPLAHCGLLGQNRRGDRDRITEKPGNQRTNEDWWWGGRTAKTSVIVSEPHEVDAEEDWGGPALQLGDKIPHDRTNHTNIKVQCLIPQSRDQVNPGMFFTSCSCRTNIPSHFPFIVISLKTTQGGKLVCKLNTLQSV